MRSRPLVGEQFGAREVDNAASDRHADENDLATLRGLQERRQLVTLDEIGGEEVRADEEHGNASPPQAVTDFAVPALAGLYIRIGPKAPAGGLVRLTPGEWLEKNPQLFQPFLILVAIANEDVVSEHSPSEHLRERVIRSHSQ